MLRRQLTLTPQHEDYLERIIELLEEKGFVRAVDVAERLAVTSASVTQMLQRLEKDGYLETEKYRGFKLTPLGLATGKKIRHRHEVLAEFFSVLQIPPAIQEHDIEGLEHSLSHETVLALEKLIRQLK